MIHGVVGRHGLADDELNSLEVVPKAASKITNAVIYLVGFSEGLTHLAALATYYLFKDDLSLSPSQVSLVFIIPSLPWILKPIFALISDTYPIFGYRRKPYLIIFSILESVGFFLLATLKPSLASATISMFLISFSTSFCTSVAEALVVESTQGKTLSEGTDNVSDFVTSKAVGSLLVAYLSGYLLEKTNKTSIFLVTSIFPLIITISSFAIVESMPHQRTIWNQITQLMAFVKNPNIWGPALYIFLYMAGPDYDDVMFFYYTNKLGFSPRFMGTLRFTYGIAALIGVWLYKTFAKGVSIKKVLMWSIFISVPIYLSPIILVTEYNKKLGLSDQAFVLSGGFLSEATAEIQLMPLLILTANLCPHGLEGSIYALMMAIRYIGSANSRGFSSVATYMFGITSKEFHRLNLYILFCGVWMLLPLCLLSALPEEDQIEKLRKQYSYSLLDIENTEACIPLDKTLENPQIINSKVEIINLEDTENNKILNSEHVESVNKEISDSLSYVSNDEKTD